jgi:hypothetical protein
MDDTTTQKIEDFYNERFNNESAVVNLTEEQWTTLGLVHGILRDLVHDMRLHPDKPDYHNRAAWHPIYKTYIDFSKHMCLDDYNNDYLYSDGWKAQQQPYEYIKRWR